MKEITKELETTLEESRAYFRKASIGEKAVVLDNASNVLYEWYLEHQTYEGVIDHILETSPEYYVILEINSYVYNYELSQNVSISLPLLLELNWKIKKIYDTIILPKDVDRIHDILEGETNE